MAALTLSIVVRMEHVPWSANAIDIRKFFAGINIPEGGVHIFGGDRGIAFVGFSSTDDANKAMQLNGGIINNSQINLVTSNRAELGDMLEKVRSGKVNMAAQLFPNSVKIPSLASSRVPYNKEAVSQANPKATVVEKNGPPVLGPISPNNLELSRKRSPEDNVLEDHKKMRTEEQSLPYIENTIGEWFVELQNLQKDVTRSHISLFLHDCVPVSESSIVIVPWMGRALVRLNGTRLLCEKALSKSGHVLHGTAIEVVEVTSQEFSLAIEATREAQSIAAAAVAAAAVVNTPPAHSTKLTKSPSPPGITKSPPQLPSVSTEYIRLANLPLQYQWHNIRALFPSARLVKDGLKLEKDNQGHFTGVAYLKFTGLEECGKALERLCNMKYDVSLLTREEYERGVADSSRASSAEPLSSYNPNVRYVAVKNIEDNSTSENVCSIFTGLDINPVSDVVFRSGGSGNNVALVRLKSESEQQAALRRNRSALGEATVTVEPASHADFEQALSHVPQVGLPGCSVMLQNLNPSMAQSDVLKLLEPFQPISESLRMHYDESGKATGRVIVAFTKPESAQRASVNLNGKHVADQMVSATVL